LDTDLNKDLSAAKQDTSTKYSRNNSLRINGQIPTKKAFNYALQLSMKERVSKKSYRGRNLIVAIYLAVFMSLAR
jgi:hypothetical protein